MEKKVQQFVRFFLRMSVVERDSNNPQLGLTVADFKDANSNSSFEHNFCPLYIAICRSFEAVVEACNRCSVLKLCENMSDFFIGLSCFLKLLVCVVLIIVCFLLFPYFHPIFCKTQWESVFRCKQSFLLCCGAQHCKVPPPP